LLTQSKSYVEQPGFSCCHKDIIKVDVRNNPSFEIDLYGIDIFHIDCSAFMQRDFGEEVLFF
jgi:hypothetical protein